jgi:hypothetical protein
MPPSTAIISAAALLAGCASQETATVKRAEKLIATYSVKSPKRAPAPPALGPGALSPDVSKKHLLELYTGQQQIIETLETRSPERDPAEGDSAERHAADLPEDISQPDLVRILGQQQKLIKALTRAAPARYPLPVNR